MQSQLLKINSIDLHCLSAGTGKLMIFLHGFPEFSYAWKKQIDFFSKDYFVMAPDLRGFNLSYKPEHLEQYAMIYLVDDIRGLMDYYHYDQCILIGHDIGGAIAVCFSEKYPEKVEKLILINTAHPAVFQYELRHTAAQQQASSYMAFLKDLRSEKIITAHHYRYFWDHMMLEVTEKKLLSKAEIKLYEKAWGIPGALTGALNYYRAWPLNIDFDKQFTSLSSVPTLVIWGEADRALTPGILKGFHRYFSNISLRKLENASHWVVHEDSLQVNQLIQEFIKNLSLSAKDLVCRIRRGRI